MQVQRQVQRQVQVQRQPQVLRLGFAFAQDDKVLLGIGDRNRM